MEMVVGVAIIGEIVFINLVYAHKGVKIFHYFPYIWLSSVFLCGWIFYNVFLIIPAVIVLAFVIFFHFIVANSPLSGE